MVSDSLGEDKAIAALTMGISDYVPKSNLQRLVPVVERAIRQVEDRRIRRGAEEALRQSEERYRELIENANDVIFSVDMVGNFTSLNRAGEQISGYSRDELTHMNMAQVLTPEDLRRAQSMIQQKLQDNQPTIYELGVDRPRWAFLPDRAQQQTDLPSGRSGRRAGYCPRYHRAQTRRGCTGRK